MAMIGLSLTLLVLMGAFALLHRLMPSVRAQRFFRRGFKADVAWWFFRFTVVEALGRVLIAVPFVLVGLMLGWNADEFARNGRDYSGFGPLSRWPGWAQCLTFALLFDFVGYWTHRLFHTGAWWRFHAVHHSPQELDWLSSVRVHPVNELLGNLWGALPPLALGLDPRYVVPLVPIIGFFALIAHANLNWTYGPLRLVFASPVFHRWHHSDEPQARNKNFAGVFPLWDALFGTLYFPKGRVPQSFGIGEQMPDGFAGQLAFPFRRRGR